MRAYTERRGDVVLATPPSDVTDASIAAFLEDLQANLDSERAYVLVVDMTDAGRLTPKHRREVGQHITRNRDRVRRIVRGIAIVTPSTIKRGFITAVFWLSPPPAEHRTFDTTDEAMRWARSLVEPETARGR